MQEATNKKLRNLDYITIKLTNKCNMDCYMCGQVYSEFRDNVEEISIEVLKKQIEKENQIKTVYLFGGEPFLYGKITQLIKFLYDKNKTTLLSTNGVFLDKYIDDLITYQVRDVSISIDTLDRELYKKIRGRDTLNIVINNINKLISEKKKRQSTYPFIGINCVILPENYNRLVEFYDFIEEKYPGISRINFESPMDIPEKLGKQYETTLKNYFNCTGESWKWFHGHVNKWSTEEISVLKNQIEILKMKAKVSFQAPTDNLGIVNTFTLKYKIPRRKCIYPFSILAVLPNGDVTFCVDFPDYILGNIKNQTLDEIWNGEKANLFRKYILEHGNLPICSRCPHRFDKDEFLIE